MDIEEANEQDLACPECGASLPPERSHMPWCKCGWSSAPDPVTKHLKIFGREDIELERRVARKRLSARKRAERDQRLLAISEQPWGRFLYLSRRLVALVLSSLIQGSRTILILAMPTILVISLVYRFWFGVIAGACGILTILLMLERRKEPGYPLRPEGTPELFRIVEDLATGGRTGPPTQIRLVEWTDFFAYHRIRWWPRPRAERVIGVGLLGMYALTMIQFKAVVAHELAHFRNRDTLAGLYIWNALDALGELVRPNIPYWPTLPYTGCNPIPVLLFALRGIGLAYYHLLESFALAASRRQELLADRFAAELVSPTALTGGLIHLGAYETAFSGQFSTIVQLIVNELDTRDVYTQFNQTWANLSERKKQEYFAEAVASFRSEYDSHPSYQDRYAALQQAVTNAAEPSEEDATIAAALLPDAEKIGQLLADRLTQRL